MLQVWTVEMPSMHKDIGDSNCADGCSLMACPKILQCRNQLFFRASHRHNVRWKRMFTCSALYWKLWSEQCCHISARYSASLIQLDLLNGNNVHYLHFSVSLAMCSLLLDSNTVNHYAGICYMIDLNHLIKFKSLQFLHFIRPIDKSALVEPTYRRIDR